jgi:hypothetical protein
MMIKCVSVFALQAGQSSIHLVQIERSAMLILLGLDYKGENLSNIGSRMYDRCNDFISIKKN